MDDLEEKIAAAAKAMREAPMNKVFTDHKGRQFLGTHSNAWARASREWMELRQELQAKKEQAR